MEHLYIVVLRHQRSQALAARVQADAGDTASGSQLSVFQCRLSRRRHANLVARLDAMIDHAKDHVVLVDIGAADGVEPRPS